MSHAITAQNLETRESLSSIETRGSLSSTVLLLGLICAVAFSPRLPIGIGALQGDVRIQDLLVVVACVYLALTPRSAVESGLRRVMPGWHLFVLGSVIVALLSVALFPSVPIALRAVYWGRGVELFVLAAVVAALYVRGGSGVSRRVIGTLYAVSVANIGWVFYQIVSGVHRTLFGVSRSSTVESYGPQLIGEPSAFGTGQFFCFVGALAAARVWSGQKGVLLNCVLLVFAFLCAYFAESRISAGVILVMFILVLSVGRGSRRSLSPVGLIVAAGLFGIFMVSVMPELQGRFSIEKIASGMVVRTEEIWSPLLTSFWEYPFVGVGPGGLVPPLRDEAHNIYLRALLDYGILLGSAFIGLFAIALFKAYRVSVLCRREDAGFFGAFAFFVLFSTLVSGFVQDALTGVVSSHLTMIAVGLLAGAMSRAGGVKSSTA